MMKWSETWMLDFNLDKSKVMHCGHNNLAAPYKMYENEINSVTKEKDLGVLVSNNLKVSAHIDEVTRKANQALGMIKHSFD